MSGHQTNQGYLNQQLHPSYLNLQQIHIPSPVMKQKAEEKDQKHINLLNWTFSKAEKSRHDEQNLW